MASRNPKYVSPSLVVVLVAVLLLRRMTHGFQSERLFITSTCSRQRQPTCLSSASSELSAAEALERTKAHLTKLQQRMPDDSALQRSDLHASQQESIQLETTYRQYLQQSANSLKQELKARKLNTKGRKPDLARRLAQHDLSLAPSFSTEDEAIVEPSSLAKEEESENTSTFPVQSSSSSSFAGMSLSETATRALHQAGFLQSPSPIQAAALPAMVKGESVLLHAPTGSGKTLAYTLPLTEFVWQTSTLEANNKDNNPPSFAVICTPTRELAAQVAGVASTLAPPGTVRLIARPTNLMTDGSKERQDRSFGSNNHGKPARIIIGSAKAIVHSLYGNDDFPAPPTPKPLALAFMKNVRVLVLDEVDRLLAVQGKFASNNKKKHERPAAILAAAVARHSLGRAQIVAASATVGRPLKRELARVLGLPPAEGPKVIVAQGGIDETQSYSEKEETQGKSQRPVPSSSRLVTIPDTVEHYIAPVAPKQEDSNSDYNNNSNSNNNASSGQLLIQAYKIIQEIVAENPNARLLLVLTRGFGISTQHVIGALQHFNCQPEPQSLLDALQQDDKTDQLVQVHRQVSGATGVGQSETTNSNGDGENNGSKASLWVTGEDTIRGLHLDGLDVVLVVGRPRGPDEYTHIAGRTGRAGRSGKVITIIGQHQASMVTSWETMLQVKWQPYHNSAKQQ